VIVEQGVSLGDVRQRATAALPARLEASQVPEVVPYDLEARKALVHGHCHHKAIVGLKADQALLSKAGIDFEVLDSDVVGSRSGLKPPAPVGRFTSSVVVGVSMLSPKQVRRLGVLLFLLFLGLTTLTLFYGSEIKGATRWISVGPFSMQPSEFLKPTFAIFAAWMFSLKLSEQRVPGNLIAIAVFGLVVFVLLKQPDLGMTAVITATWFAQFFVAGLPFIWVILFAGLGSGGGPSAASSISGRSSSPGMVG